MNFRLYIFGESSGYKQYPEDSLNFKSWFRDQQSTSLLNIQRKADLVYYIYTQKIDRRKNAFLGFCLVFNGVYIKNLRKAFTIFEKAYSDCILSGKLFKIHKNGTIDFATDNFGAQEEEIDRLTALFNEELDNKSRSLFATLPKTYKIGLGNKQLSISDKAETVGNAISTFDSVSIPNNNGNEELDYVNQMIQQLYTENKTLRSNYSTLNKQKKQYKWVAFLSLAVIASLVGLYSLNNNLSGVISNQGETISNLQDTIKSQKGAITLLNTSLITKDIEIQNQSKKIENLNQKVVSYRDSLQTSRNNEQSLQSELSDYRYEINKFEEKFSSLKTYFPIVITDIEIGNEDENYGHTLFSSDAWHLHARISYIGLSSGKTIDFMIKWYKPDGTLIQGNFSPPGYSDKSSIYVYRSYNNQKLCNIGYNNKGYWDKGSYRIEIWYKDVCLKAKKFTIY
ncbi:MAG: hypothetical protein IJY36_07410 [Coprobacter sp.]|nr:hypothetical protein [Coprobacter sp.]